MTALCKSTGNDSLRPLASPRPRSSDRERQYRAHPELRCIRQVERRHHLFHPLTVCVGAAGQIRPFSWSGVRIWRFTETLATGVSLVSYSVSVTSRLVTATGNVRNGPQNNSTVGSDSGGCLCRLLPAAEAEEIARERTLRHHQQLKRRKSREDRSPPRSGCRSRADRSRRH